MPNKKQKSESLVSLIKASKVIDKPEQKEFLKLVPLMNHKQLDEAIAFFRKAEKDIQSIEDRYAKKKSQAYTKYLPKLNEVFKQAKKMVLEEAEAKSVQEDESAEDDILHELEK